MGDFHRSTFNDEMVTAVVDLMSTSLDLDTREEINDIVDAEVGELFSVHLPPRSMEQTAVPWVETVSLSSRMVLLLSVPQVQQRTEEWYEQRRDRITASSAAKALGSQAKN